MQKHGKLKKIVSSVLIFSILFSFTIDVRFFSFIGTVVASDTKYYNLVSIFVQEDIYDDIKIQVDTYAKNIQKTLENTKVIIIPTPKNQNPFNIASINERLYFEGEGGIFGTRGNSKLVGTIFVGDLPLPVVSNNNSLEKTVFPYVDFVDKLYIYDHNEKIYKINKDITKDPEAEIWHGFISPNTGDTSEDIKQIKDYFSKNEDYYSGRGNFKNEEGITNGRQDEDLMKNYEPVVFYYDQFRESKAIKYTDYKAYESFLNNIEDITYNRFSSELAEVLKENYFGSQKDFIGDISKIIGTGSEAQKILSNIGPTTNNIPDIQNRFLIGSTTKRFLQIFNESVLGNFRKDVHNAGRYNSGSKVGVDIIPYLISSIDEVSRFVIKNANSDLEEYIDNLVKKGLSRDIAIPTDFKIGGSVYTNFLFGKQAKDISSAGECTFYRGSTYNSGQLVQANRGFNVNLVSDDIRLCSKGETNGYWGGNSPINLNPSLNGGNIWQLKSSDYKNAVVPLYDILGSLRVNDATKNPKPQDCFENNLLLTSKTDSDGNIVYSVPINGLRAQGWSCNTTNLSLNYPYDFDYTFKNFPTLPVESCENHYLKLDGIVLKSYSNTDCATYSDASGNIITETPSSKVYNFHKIHSWIEHKSPSSDDLAKQTQYMISPNLPIDRDRYIDFIAADNSYARINYPYLFRVTLNENEEFSLENARKSLKKYLDQKSTEINSLITSKSGNPGIFSTGPYPSPNVDLYNLLKSKPDKEVEILGSKKKLSYIDTLVFSIYWNNLNSVGAKYKFIIENYLSDQFGGNNFNFFLPKNKKQYEIAYLGADGDARNMYIKLDPEDKAENPYSDVISNNLILSNLLLGNRGNVKSSGGGNFKCAPPEGVPIWKWIPAIICRLKDMLPPKISVTDQGCGSSLFSFGKNDFEVFGSEDLNKNGISDYLEKELKDGSLKLKSDSSKYYYNVTGKLEANLLNASGSEILFDNVSVINFELVKVEVPSDPTKPFDEANKKVIFDKLSSKKSSQDDEDVYNEVSKYIHFKDLSVTAKEGKATYSFVTKSKDANVTFKASVVYKDQRGNVVVSKEDFKTVQIRGDLFYANNYKLSRFNDEFAIVSGFEGVISSANSNIFLVDNSSFNTLKSNLESLNSLSNSKEKIFISLINVDRNGNSLPINYPIRVKITDKNGNLIGNSLSFVNLSSPKSLGSFKEAGTLYVEIKDSAGLSIKKEVEVLPDVAVEIEPNLSTSLIEKGGVITTNVFTIYDQFKNPTIGDNYEVEASISGDSLTFEDGSVKTVFNVIEGYKLFRLRSTGRAGVSNITFKLKKDKSLIQTKALSVSVVDKIDFVITGLPDKLRVGNNSYSFNLKVLNAPKNTEFNSRAYLIANSLYLTPDREYIEIKNNFGTGSFTVATKAGEKVKLEFKVEGVKDSFYEEVSILPDLPIKLDLTLSKSKLEASSNSTSNLHVELRDRYNNVVWNDNSTLLNLEIPEKYSHIIKAEYKSTKVRKGKATFVLNATNVPGTAFFRVYSTPDLSSNKIEIVGQSPFRKEELDDIPGMRHSGILTDVGRKFFEEYDLNNYRFKYYDKSVLQSSDDFKALTPLQKSRILSLYDAKNKLIISGIGENAGKIETFYFWNKNKIKGKKYNSIYTTLLGSNYGDITVKDNLANSILFDKGNRALAITSLLNNPNKDTEILSINPNGNIVLNANSSDLSQDISTDFNLNDGNLEINFFNNTFDRLVSSIYFNLKNISLLSCKSVDLRNCLKEDKNIVAIKSIDNPYKVNLNRTSGLSLVDKDGIELLNISPDGKISKSVFIQFEISNSYNDGLILNIKHNGKIIGNLAIKFSTLGKVNFIRDIGVLDSTKNLQANGGLVVYIETRDYYYSQKYLGSSTRENLSYAIYYNDPFQTKSGFSDNFSSYFTKGYENFSTDGGIGWGGENKTLLSFASGESVGDSTRKYMSFSLINIGDPVVSLKKIKKKLPGTSKDRKFDSTIGYLISKDDKNIAYSTFDYNNDKSVDIVVLKKDGHIELLEGIGDTKNFINRGNLAYVADFGGRPILQTGDFTGDGYDDIVVLNKNRKPVLLNNNKKDFVRINLDLRLNGIISQLVSYDMDLDGKHDLVTLDDSGEINVSYGTAKVGVFEKKLVGSGFAITLNSDTRKDGGVLYFSGLYQIPEDKIQDYIRESLEILNKERIKDNTGTGSEENEFNEGLVDKLIFTQISYGDDAQTENNKLDVLKNLPDLSTLKAGGVESDHAAITDFILNSSENLNPGKTQYNLPKKTKTLTFIRSEYAEYEGLRVEKKFRDENGSPLRVGDKIKLDIRITNNLKRKVDNIAYVDKIPDLFKLSENKDFILSIGRREVSKENVVLKPSPSDDYTFLIDSYKEGGIEKPISLNPGESIYLSLSLDTNAFEYGYIEAGIFDDTTSHGDIIFKNKNENCGKPYKLFKSISVRDFQREDKAGVCESKLPDFIEKNTVDTDNNGVPDYIDDLISGGVSGTGIQDYAKDKLKEFYKDTDKDGLVDREELSPYMNNDEDFINSLDSINESVDKIISGIDFILDGLTCGFGGPGCISTPLNRAPLAPGNDPTIFGIPIGDGLNIGEGIPIFSALNWMKVGKHCLPMIWPPAKNLPGCRLSGAGGRLGTLSPTNFIRLFVTPTLTGAMGIAICFGAPPIVAGQTNPKGFHPLTPGGNCIVASVPIGCKNDGSEGEIYNKGVYSKGNGNIIINGNCPGDDNAGKAPYLGDVVKEYLSYKKTGVKSNSLKANLKKAFSQVARGGGKWQLSSDPLLTIGQGDSDFDIEVDFSALKSGNYEDVIKIKMTRISPFPDFIMEWVTRQIEEIANKLTDFPTLYVILPDFDPVFDSGWGNFVENIKKQFKQGQEKAEAEQNKIQSQIEAKQKELENTDCEKDRLSCYLNKSEILKLQGKKNIGSNKTVGGIKAVYEFISNLPMISIQPQKVTFNLPWLDKKTVDKAIKDFELTKLQRIEELERAKKAWDLENYKSIGTNTDPGNRAKIIVNTQNLIDSIDKNIEILNDYKRLPEKIHKMLKIKEIRINQILCNIETISKIMGGWIGENGKRFKAWVELYVLIKAILKSWQLLVDIFIDYSAECHQCKNERRDLMYYVWKIISAVMPRIPVIQFPKWPDIYLDLHNIRAQLNIGIPEYEFNLRPIIIPPLPKLYLPDSPNVNINLPELPLLPRIELMELPDLPALPKIELPNLPPPPKLPKLFSSIEVFLNLLKIITKVMCVLRTSPFVPEWRAGDQIAFISERGGYLSLDFLDISLPQFSFPFVDAIKVTTYVNLEMDVDFLVEMSRQAALPLNVFSNNIANILNISIGDLDFRDATLSDIDVDIGSGKGSKSSQGTIKIRDEGAFNIKETDNMKKIGKRVSIHNLANLIILSLLKLYRNIDKESKVNLTNKEFKGSISKQLSKIKNEKIVGVWKNALNYSFEKENKLINDLLLNNEEKFNELRSILNEEKAKNSMQMMKLSGEFLGLGKKEILVRSSDDDRFKGYNERLRSYNLKALNSIKNLFELDREIEEIRGGSKKILNGIKSGIDNFPGKLNERKSFENVKQSKTLREEIISLALNNLSTNSESKSNLSLDNNPSSNLLALNSEGSPQTSENSYSTGSCLGKKSNLYSYVYKGIYIVEEYLNKKISYLLFDYTDELSGKERFSDEDFDKDGDEDIIYMVGNEIYIKENLTKKKVNKEYYSGNPLILRASDNVFYKNDFIESVNGLEESISDSNYINLRFSDSTNSNISNYSIEFYSVVDKFDDLMNGFSDFYIPKNVKRYVIDTFRDIDEITIMDKENTSTGFKVRKNLAYIDSIGNLAGVTLKTKELKNLKDDLNSNKEVTINAGTRIYSASDSVRLTYYLHKDKNKELKLRDVSINAYSNIEFDEDIVLVGISGNAYVELKSTIELKGNSIISYVKKPLIPGAKIEYDSSKIIPGTIKYVSVKYYDGSVTDLDFSRDAYYELYDLGNRSDSYLVRTGIENDYYYLKIRSFKDNKFSTYSNQALISPQKEADTKAPEITNFPGISVPVYQSKTIDVTDYVFENSGIKNIKSIYIDSDLEKDSDNNGNAYDDKDYLLGRIGDGINIKIQGSKILLDVGPFDRLHNKNVRITVIDSNGNVGYKDVPFIVYSPIPAISNVFDNKIIGSINEPISKEPVSFYRIRGGSIDKIVDKDGLDTTNTVDGGNFSFDLGTKSSLKDGLKLSYLGQDIFRIDEHTGKIDISDFDKIKHKIRIIVYPSNDKNNDLAYPKIIVLKEDIPIYYQYLVTPNIGKVEIVDSFEGLNEVGVYYRNLSSEYEPYSIPLGVPNNFGDLMIISSKDKSQPPIFKIFKDGKIFSLSERYYLEYSSYNNHVVYNLKEVGNEKLIGSVMIIPEKNFIMK